MTTITAENVGLARSEPTVNNQPDVKCLLASQKDSPKRTRRHPVRS